MGAVEAMTRSAPIFTVAIVIGFAAVLSGAADPQDKGAVPTESQGECRATLVVVQTQGAEGCWIDERVTRQPGVLTYPCSGGPAVARFGQTAFTGSVGVQGAVTLSVRTRFHFGDGCDWGTVQNIEGVLSSGQLRYTYVEAPLPGQQGCAGACRAAATVTVRPDAPGNRSPGAPAPQPAGP